MPTPLHGPCWQHVMSSSTGSLPGPRSSAPMSVSSAPICMENGTKLSVPTKCQCPSASSCSSCRAQPQSSFSLQRRFLVLLAMKRLFFCSCSHTHQAEGDQQPMRQVRDPKNLLFSFCPCLQVSSDTTSCKHFANFLKKSTKLMSLAAICQAACCLGMTTRATSCPGTPGFL